MSSIIVATLGGQPQVVTLALDLLLQHAPSPSALHLFHLDPIHTPRYGVALAAIRRTFDQGSYGALRLVPEPLRLHGASLADIDSPDAADAVYDALHRRLQTLKATGASLHLLPTGGRRLLGMLLLSAAQAVCERTDRIWYVASSDAVRQATRDGAQLHLPGHPEVRLVRVPFTPVGQFIAPLQDPASGRASPAEQARLAGCAEVWRRLTPRQREVLEALRAAGPPNLLQQAANQLAIQPSTLDEHKTRILDVCRDVWQLHEQPRLTVHWLREQFIGFAPRV